MKFTHMFPAIKIQISLLISRGNIFLDTKLTQILMSKTSLTLLKKNTEFHGKKCTGRLLRFLTMQTAKNAVKTF